VYARLRYEPFITAYETYIDFIQSRLKYQIDKILRSADDATRRSTPGTAKPTPKSRKSNANTGSDSDISDAESAGSAQTADSEDEMAYGPRRAQVTRQKTEAAEERARESKNDGIYRPPKITPMAMPTPEGRGEARRERRPGKSATLDEFIATELSTAPIAEPSIGSTIVNGGRHTKSERERREENERREYEESNFTRLAPLGKKELAKQKARQQRNGGFGGEEWRSLGQGLDRIERLTEKKGGKLGSLEKSRKRPVGDGPRGTGAGEAFEKRRKVVGRYK
jgi:U3 small nucleolar ribonucleoprotein protein LCP5